jgi:bifunctional UDP-N-acetylglucosamine pyrophosphorylase/glucosamine-1-phosphate N-acetyltransferase
VFEHIFDHPTRIADEASLREAFGTDRLHLGAASAVTFQGRIGLGHDVSFFGDCSLRGDLTVDSGSILTSVSLGAGSRVRPYSILTDVAAGARNLFGPFCFIRDHCVIADDCILGAHVEAARSSFASGVKVSHRAFVGDARVGARTIIGAGVVFCNYDGAGRQGSAVGAGVTLGSGVLLVSPVTIGDDAVIGAGATITRDVPAGARIIQKRQ